MLDFMTKMASVGLTVFILSLIVNYPWGAMWVGFLVFAVGFVGALVASAKEN